ncbi:hypothetical protein V6N13_042888 [Hibiscus sabdariffa]|uniref:Uncharacterized protein n=2 Tax=Hibiscus sabdariffa TaxID=183260 RepID=A0ABR1Z845_9ROSI
MLGKKMCSLKKLAKKVKGMGGGEQSQSQSQYECLLREFEQTSPSASTPSGFFAVYVGEDEERFVVPTSFLSHPLFKMLLDKSFNEYGFEGRDKLVVPCCVSTFQQVVNAVDCCNGQFHFGKLVEDLL